MGLSYSSQFIPGSSIMRPFFVLLLLWYAAIPVAVFAQDGDSQESAQCTFDDGKQMIVRYNSLKVGKNDSPPYGKTWSPGGAAMTLFTEAEVTLGGKTVPTGGYTMYLVPGKKDWSLIVSKNTSATAAYSESQDLARGTMESGMMPEAEKEFKAFFGHLGPKTCEFNISYGKVRAWTEFKEK